MLKSAKKIAALVLLAAILLSGCADIAADYDAVLINPAHPSQGGGNAPAPVSLSASLDALPAFDGEHPWVELNQNVPEFTDSEKQSLEAFETYGEWDSLGRCTTAYANICQALMPTEKRGQISQIKPSGWQSVQYDNVDGKSLYNRCHLIGFQLAGENANKLNLITGTRYMNVEGMLPFENMVADYVKETDGHVLYRVTPIYAGDNLVASGVQMEGWSVEDKGESVCYNVYCYNVQPGIGIDYATGGSWLDNTAGSSPTANSAQPAQTYILNTSSKKFHLESCSGAASISAANRDTFTGTYDELIAQGYTPCGICKP